MTVKRLDPGLFACHSGLTTARATAKAAFRFSDTVTALVTGMMILGTLAVIHFPGTDFGIVHGVGSHALLWNLRYADYGGKLSVLRPL